MNELDRVAERVGVRDGRLDLFTLRPDQAGTLAPTVTGAVGGPGVVLKLEWPPGQ